MVLEFDVLQKAKNLSFIFHFTYKETILHDLILFLISQPSVILLR